MTVKRLFFALDCHADWHPQEPEGRKLRLQDRHCTLAFLGQCDYGRLSPLLKEIPLPALTDPVRGMLDKLLPLSSDVLAMHIDWQENFDRLDDYRRTLLSWLEENKFSPSRAYENWLPHVTMCRRPYRLEEWERIFTPFPMEARNLHLYESLGSLTYRPLWSYSLLQG